mgnify:FL=1|jgi:hypothetical protein
MFVTSLPHIIASGHQAARETPRRDLQQECCERLTKPIRLVCQPFWQCCCKPLCGARSIKCERLAIGSNRGTLLPDIGSNVRKTGVLGRFTVVFAVERETVLILRIFMAGRDWETDMEHGDNE